MKNADMPAFVESERAGDYAAIGQGLSKREHFAGLAMQGLLASGPHDCDEHGVAHDAVLNADALLAALERTNATPTR
ncbi:hypothetical protein J4377_13645 [Halomonas sp. XH26]|uniref:hypothetical protein n=1 Tax=Halomonas sp. XH26 TaxID=2557993 RepID=UPI0020A093D0|nr:hypothetical protein [Halomonas sp. XH26]UTA78996.1 hypothetical protein J4377_13645 [Halomonas sp. XH26]